MNETISKSALKRRFKEDEQVAGELALLTARDLQVLPAGEELKEVIAACRGLQGGARKRQVKYLAKLLRLDNGPAILDFLVARKGSKRKGEQLLREAERLRDVVINEAIAWQQEALQVGEVWEPDWPGEELAAVVARYPLEAGELRGAVYQYVRTRLHSHNREVFRIIRTALEKAAAGRTG